MELVLENPSLLKKSIEIISDIVIEGTFVFKSDYMELVALNSNNVVMVIFRLLSSNFTKYDVEEGKQISLSLEHLSQVLKTCDDKAELKIIVENEGKLKIISNSKSKKEFSLSLIDYNDENLQKVPNLEFPIKVVTSSSSLSDAISDLGFIEEGVAIGVKDNVFFMEGKTNSMAGKVEFLENIDIENKSQKDVLCRYSMEYLKKFSKADKLVKTVEFSFNSDYPIKIEYKLVDKLLLGFILAPRGEE